MTITPAPSIDSARRGAPNVPPPFPAVVLRLIQEMQNPELSAAEVSKLIELDPALTITLLRLVNSPFYGLRGTVAKVSDAVLVLGVSAVRRMVLSVSVAGSLRRPDIDPAFAREQWLHSVSCGAFARRLVEADATAAELAFTAGLLHDVGQVHLLLTHGPSYMRVLSLTSGEEQRAAELTQFGQSHDTLGAALLESWGLPDVICEAAAAHHDAAPTGKSVVPQAVWVAQQLSTATNPAPGVVLSLRGIAPIKQAMHEAQVEIEALGSLLN